MKVAVAGSKGQLGVELCQQLTRDEERKWEVVGFDLDELDICDEKSVLRFMIEKVPDVVVNCAAYTDVDGCESNEKKAYRVNALGARNLAASAYQVGAKILQISTDYVFDGMSTQAIREFDPIGPINVYGQSKALGEKLVRAVNPRHFILRTAWLYGEGRNFVRTVLALTARQRELSIVDDQIGTPTSTDELARCIIRLIGTKSYGIYHATCQGSCSWYGFAKKIFALTGVSVRLKPIKTSELHRPARRPRFSVLENFMLDLVGLNTFSPWEDALKRYLDAMNRSFPSPDRR